MTTARESGRLLMLRVEQARWSAGLERLLHGIAPGGVLLDCALSQSPDATREFLRKISTTAPHLPFLALREEGGRQGPLQKLFPGLPSPRAAAENGPATAGRLGELIGEGLSLLGFNTNFAPTLDLATETIEKTIDDRSFGLNPKLVAECGGAFVRGIAAQKILACAKHFPGLGSVPLPAAGSLPESAKPMAALWREDLLPYRELSPHLPMILMSSASYKAYDFDRPRRACLSPLVVEGLLRAKLGYQGVVVAYDFESKNVRSHLSVSEVAVESLLAGCDMMIVNADEVEETARALRGALDSGKISAERVRESLARIEEAFGRVQATRKRLRRPTGKLNPKAFEKLARECDDFAKICRE